MKCTKCGLRESTGVLIQLCNPCFDEWEATVNNDPANADIGPINPALVYQKYGGSVPDKVKTATVAHEGDAVIIRYQK